MIVLKISVGLGVVLVSACKLGKAVASGVEVENGSVESNQLGSFFVTFAPYALTSGPHK